MASGVDLIRAVLDELNVVSAGQDVSAEDAESASARIGWALADLRARMLAPDLAWPAEMADAIPDQLMPPLIKYLAQECATIFGKDADASAKLAAEQIMRTQAGVGQRLRRRIHLDPVMARSFRG